MKNLYTLYYLHKLNTVVNLGMLGKISSYPTYPIAVILKMAMHLEDPELTALRSIGIYTSRILFRDMELRLESSSMKSVYAGVTMRLTEEKP